MLLDDIKTFLIANGITDIYKTDMPDEPNEAVCLYEYAGFGPQLDHGGIAWRNPAIQVSVRSQDYQTARAKIESIYLLLSALINSQVGVGTQILHATPVQEPFSLGPDLQGRVKLVCNFDIAIQ